MLVQTWCMLATNPKSLLVQVPLFERTVDHRPSVGVCNKLKYKRTLIDNNITNFQTPSTRSIGQPLLLPQWGVLVSQPLRKRDQTAPPPEGESPYPEERVRQKVERGATIPFDIYL